MIKKRRSEKSCVDSLRGEKDHQNLLEPNIETLLEELDTRSNGFQIDLDVGGDLGAIDNTTPVDFSVSKDLVPLTNEPVVSDSTASRHLAKMSDFEFLDPYRLQEKRIIHPDMDDYSIMNSFREIRTRLLQKSENKNFVLMVVSIGHSMGATFTTVNLGAVFSYEGEKTALLIDCHAQKSNISAMLGLEKTIGLSDYINNPEIELGQIICSTGISRMRLIPFGSLRTGRLEFLASNRMRELISTVKRRYEDRYIIINAPPIELSADAAILSEAADYILVVVPYGKVSKGKINKALRSLPPEKIAGVVMNNCKRYV